MKNQSTSRFTQLYSPIGLNMTPLNLAIHSSHPKEEKRVARPNVTLNNPIYQFQEGYRGAFKRK